MWPSHRMIVTVPIWALLVVLIVVLVRLRRVSKRSSYAGATCTSVIVLDKDACAIDVWLKSVVIANQKVP